MTIDLNRGHPRSRPWTPRWRSALPVAATGLIAASPTDLDHVLETIAASAARLIRVDRTLSIYVRRGDRLFRTAFVTGPEYGPQTPEQEAIAEQLARGVEISRRGALGRCKRTCSGCRCA